MWRSRGVAAPAIKASPVVGALEQVTQRAIPHGVIGDMLRVSDKSNRTVLGGDHEYVVVLEVHHPVRGILKF